MFWFVLALIFFILWVRARSGKVDAYDEYIRGYKEGYSRFKSELSDALNLDGGARSEKLEQLKTSVVEVEQSQERKIESQREDVYGEFENEGEYDTVVADEDVVDSPSRTQEESVYSQPVLSEADIAAEKEASTLKNLNIALYMASFLFVAAAAAFIGAAMPSGVRLLGLIMVVVLFYGSGVALHVYSTKLQPAATAFIGTGLAILPFIGIALTSLGGVSGDVAWLTTSIIGLVAYYVAAIILQNQFVSYLSVAFVLSLASSMVATASLPIVWYFMAMIGVSLLASSISYLKPAWLPEVFSKPVESTGQIITPLALVASLFVGDKASIAVYETVFAMATAHYLVAWLQRQTMIYETGVRILAHMTLLIIAWDVINPELGEIQLVGIAWLGLAAVQALYSLVRVQVRSLESRQFENCWLIASSALIVCGMLWWSGDAHDATLRSLSILSAGLLALSAMFRLRDVRWAYLGLAASVILPFVVGREAALEFGEAWPWSVMTGIFAVMSFGALGLYRYVAGTYSKQSLNFCSVAVGLYVLALLLCGLSADATVVAGWAFALAAMVVGVFSHLRRESNLEVPGAVLGAIAAWLWLWLLPIEPEWFTTVGAVVVAGLLTVVAAAYHLLGYVDRRNNYIILAMISYLGVALSVFAEKDIVGQIGLLLMIAAVTGSLVLRTISSDKTQILRTIFSSSYLVFAAALIPFSVGLNDGWPALALTAAALTVWMASYIENKPYILFGGNLLFVFAIGSLWSWLDFSNDWRILGVACVSSVVFYAMYGLALDRSDKERELASIVSTWITLGVAIALTIFSSNEIVASGSAAVLVAASATVLLYGYLQKSKDIIEIGLYIAIAGLQRIVYVTMPDIDWIIYAHWWAIVIALTAWWRTDASRKMRMMIAVGVVTVSVGLSALGGNTTHQLLFLFEHVGLLIAGVLLKSRWAIWWGVVASVVAVLYFLKDFLYLWLALLGCLLLGLVIWRLKAMGERK